MGSGAMRFVQLPTTDEGGFKEALRCDCCLRRWGAPSFDDPEPTTGSGAPCVICTRWPLCDGCSNNFTGRDEKWLGRQVACCFCYAGITGPGGKLHKKHRPPSDDEGVEPAEDGKSEKPPEAKSEVPPDVKAEEKATICSSCGRPLRGMPGYTGDLSVGADDSELVTHASGRDFELLDGVDQEYCEYRELKDLDGMDGVDGASSEEASATATSEGELGASSARVSVTASSDAELHDTALRSPGPARAHAAGGSGSSRDACPPTLPWHTPPRHADARPVVEWPTERLEEAARLGHDEAIEWLRMLQGAGLTPGEAAGTMVAVPAASSSLRWEAGPWRSKRS